MQLRDTPLRLRVDASQKVACMYPPCAPINRDTTDRTEGDRASIHKIQRAEVLKMARIDGHKVGISSLDISEPATTHGAYLYCACGIALIEP